MLQDFINHHTGVRTGNTGPNTGQCVGLVAVWFDTEMEPHVWGDAKDLYNNAGAGYTKGTSWPAPEGSAIVLGSSWGAGAGHTGLVAPDGRIFEQNNPTGSNPHLSNYGSRPRDYIGWILPNNYKGETMSTVNSGDIHNMYGNLLGHTENVNDVSAWSGKDWNPFMYDLINRQDFKDRMAAFNKQGDQIKAMTDQINALNDQVKQYKANGGSLIASDKSSYKLFTTPLYTKEV